MTKHQLATESATFTKAWELASANPVVALAVATAVAVILVTASPVFQGLKKFPSKKTTLQKDKVVALRLKKKIIVSHDTRIFQFALPSEEHVLGLPIGQHVMVSIAGTNVQRSYTPISSDDDKGIVELMIKVYKAGVHPKFPEGGKMSQHMDSLREGIDTMNFRGPTGRFEYKGRGHCFAKRDRHIKRMAMIGGGTGITPLLQVIRAVLKDPEDQTQIALIFANRNEQDILLREELEVRAKDPRFKVWFTLSNPPQNWNYGSGHITEDMIKEHLFPASDDTLVLMCGPPPMITHACKPNLEKAGYTAEHYVVF